MDDDGIITRLQQRQINREIAQLAKLYQRTTAQECLPALQKVCINEDTTIHVYVIQLSLFAVSQSPSKCGARMLQAVRMSNIFFLTCLLYPN